MLRELLVDIQRVVLLLVARVGHDPLVAVVCKREARRSTLARRAVDRNRVRPRHTGLEKARIPVLGIYPRHQIEFAGLPVLRVVEVAHLRRIVLLAERVARDVLLYGHAVLGHAGRQTPRRHVLIGGTDIVVRVRRTVLALKVGEETGILQRACRRERHAEALGLAAALGRDEDHAVLSQRTVESRGGRAFEHRHRLDIVGIEVGHRVTEVDRGVVVGVVGTRARSHRTRDDGDTVDDEQSLVRAVVQRRVSSQRHAHRTAGARTCRRH